MIEQKTIKSGVRYKKGYYNPTTEETSTDIKDKIRYEIENQVLENNNYNIFDILADLSKRCNMLERIIMLLLKDHIDNNNLPAVLDIYKPLIEYYITSITDGTYKSRTDLEENKLEVLTKLMERDNKITEILQKNGY